MVSKPIENGKYITNIELPSPFFEAPKTMTMVKSIFQTFKDSDDVKVQQQPYKIFVGEPSLLK